MEAVLCILLLFSFIIACAGLVIYIQFTEAVLDSETVDNETLATQKAVFKSRSAYVRICAWLCTLAMAGIALYHDHSPAGQWLAVLVATDLSLRNEPWLLAILRSSPLSQFLPITALICLAVWLLATRDMSAVGFAAGGLGTGQVTWTVICVVLSTLALAGWSLFLVQGDHGPIQDSLGPMLTPWTILPIAIVNALREELEARCLHIGGWLALVDHPGNGGLNYFWLAVGIAICAVHFALQHVAGGFPSGVSGGVLVFVWGVFLGLLRWWTGGMLLVILLHVQADFVIFVLIMRQEQILEQQQVGLADSSGEEKAAILPAATR